MKITLKIMKMAIKKRMNLEEGLESDDHPYYFTSLQNYGTFTAQIIMKMQENIGLYRKYFILEDIDCYILNYQS